MVLCHRPEFAELGALHRVLERVEVSLRSVDADVRAIAWFDKYLKPKPLIHTLLISDHGPNGEIAEIEWPSGKVLWKNDSISQQDAGRNDLSPQGYLLATKDTLFGREAAFRNLRVMRLE